MKLPRSENSARWGAFLLLGALLIPGQAQTDSRRADKPVPRSSTGLVPLTEMSASERYKAEDGGLYGGGMNEPPPALAAAARTETAAIRPLNREGDPTPDGKIVLVSISMSNATQEFSLFKKLADADRARSPALTIVDCAQGGQAMEDWADHHSRTWSEAERRLKAAGVSPRQVQVAWIKLANKRPSGELAAHGKKLQADTTRVLQEAHARYPNLRIVYLGSRTYGGYATVTLNPEPYAYESAFVARRLIQAQADGAAGLNHDPARGTVQAPLLLWGPYLWTDGINPRLSDGLVWTREDVRATDGTHPSESGRRKVADLLLAFFKGDPNAKKWFAVP